MATDPDLNKLMDRYADRRFATHYPRELEVVVDRERARFSTWYELFPRSCVDTPGRHGTFRDLEARLPYIAEMGFDVLYLPPIHPIGHTKRKGRNNALIATPRDPGSPWAIGSQEGGHKATHPELGTLDDFRRFLEAARGYDIEIALDDEPSRYHDGHERVTTDRDLRPRGIGEMFEHMRNWRALFARVHDWLAPHEINLAKMLKKEFDGQEPHAGLDLSQHADSWNTVFSVLNRKAEPDVRWHNRALAKFR